MKMSLCQMIAIACICAVGFGTVAPFLQQEAYGGADEYQGDAYEVRSFATGQVVTYDVQPGGGPVNTSHYGYYHNPGSSTAAWEHYQTWPSGHSTTLNLNIIGTRWVP